MRPRGVRLLPRGPLVKGIFKPIICPHCYLPPAAEAETEDQITEGHFEATGSKLVAELAFP